VEQEGLSDHTSVDSAGTHACHVNEPPDRRDAQEAARKRAWAPCRPSWQATKTRRRQPGASRRREVSAGAFVDGGPFVG